MRKPAEPKITVSKSDHDRLLGLASSAPESAADAAETLLTEMERAKIIADKAVPDDLVQMGSTVEFTSDDGGKRRVTLVFPGEADIDAGKVSVLTPIGAALIGLRTGQSITWTTRDGREQRLTIGAVQQPAEAAS